jgi:2,3-bisphosphoglycerate-independent phosphoglycerate mutase
MSLHTRRPLALIILDGWGVSPSFEGNAIAAAHTPYCDAICERFPVTTLAASGVRVGLSDAQCADAEVGHRTIGAGRIVETDAARIARFIATGRLRKSEALRSAFGRVSAARRSVHFVGLLSDAGVHSSQETLFALLRMAKAVGVRDAFVHGILDGRDVRPRTADVYVEALEIKMADIGLGKVASLCGRFFAMDSGENWERTARAFTMLVHGEGERGFDAVSAIRASFLRGISDEFIAPIVIEQKPDVPLATIKDGDLVVFFNHNAEPMRQLVRSLAVPDAASVKPKVEAVTLVEYDPGFKLPVVFEPDAQWNSLAAVFEQNGIANSRITESSRSRHVSDYFNGAMRPTECEKHAFLHSPGPHALASEPESKSFKIADTFLRGLDAADGGVFVVNFPAAGMAVETGNFERTIEAIQYVDTCLGGVVGRMREVNGITVITASHAGCEKMNDPHNAAHVPFHLVDPEETCKRLASGGSLEDVAPTLLGVLGIEQPNEMTGRDLRG